MSVTELIAPPRIKILQKKHWDDIEYDVSEMFFKDLGKAFHNMAEAGADEEHISEERLFMEIDGWTVSGGIDVQKITPNDVGVIDYKVTGAYSVMTYKPEWEAQLNSYAALIRHVKGWDIKWLKVCAGVRDWNKHDAKNRAHEGYPQAQLWMVDVLLWSPKDQLKFLSDRIALLREARRADEWDDPLPACTYEERWMNDEKWQVLKDGNKKALRSLKSEGEANQWLSEYWARGKNENYRGKVRVSHKIGLPIRCVDDYCKVSKWCEIHQQWLKANTIEGPK